MPRTRATVCKWRASMATRTVPRLSAVVISVIVPTYNEAGSLPPLVERLASAMAGHTWELVVVDDGSPDGTADVAARLSATHPVWVVRRAGKAGLASAVIAGFNESRGDILVVMDADLSHPPETVPALVKAIDDGADLAVGSRYVKGGATMDWPLRRRVVSRVACLIGNVLVPVRDATSGFFAVRRTAIDGVRLNAIGFKIGFEVIARARTKTVVEVPYTFRDRELGASKFGRRRVRRRHGNGYSPGRAPRPDDLEGLLAQSRGQHEDRTLHRRDRRRARRLCPPATRDVEDPETLRERIGRSHARAEDREAHRCPVRRDGAVALGRDGHLHDVVLGGRPASDRRRS